MGCMFGSDYSHLISQEISITLQRTHQGKQVLNSTVWALVATIRTLCAQVQRAACRVACRYARWKCCLSCQTFQEKQVIIISFAALTEGGWQALCPLLTSMMCTLHETPWLLLPCKKAGRWWSSGFFDSHAGRSIWQEAAQGTAYLQVTSTHSWAANKAHNF